MIRGMDDEVRARIYARAGGDGGIKGLFFQESSLRGEEVLPSLPKVEDS